MVLWSDIASPLDVDYMSRNSWNNESRKYFHSDFTQWPWIIVMGRRMSPVDRHQKSITKASFSCDTWIMIEGSFPKDSANTFSQHSIENNDTANYKECSSAFMLFQNDIYATNESFVHMHIFEYSRMNRQNSFSTAFLPSVRWKNLVCW